MFTLRLLDGKTYLLYWSTKHFVLLWNMIAASGLHQSRMLPCLSYFRPSTKQENTEFKKFIYEYMCDDDVWVRSNYWRV